MNRLLCLLLGGHRWPEYFHFTGYIARDAMGLHHAEIVRRCFECRSEQRGMAHIVTATEAEIIKGAP